MYDTSDDEQSTSTTKYKQSSLFKPRDSIKHETFQRELTPQILEEQIKKRVTFAFDDRTNNTVTTPIKKS